MYYFAWDRQEPPLRKIYVFEWTRPLSILNSNGESALFLRELKTGVWGRFCRGENVHDRGGFRPPSPSCPRLPVARNWSRRRISVIPAHPLSYPDDQKHVRKPSPVLDGIRRGSFYRLSRRRTVAMPMNATDCVEASFAFTRWQCIL